MLLNFRSERCNHIGKVLYLFTFILTKCVSSSAKMCFRMLCKFLQIYWRVSLFNKISVKLNLFTFIWVNFQMLVKKATFNRVKIQYGLVTFFQKCVHIQCDIMKFDQIHEEIIRYIRNRPAIDKYGMLTSVSTVKFL